MKALRGYLMIMGAAFFWGVSATVAKGLLNQEVETILIVQTRVTFSALLFFGFYLIFKRHILIIQRSDIWRFALLGVLGLAGANFTYYFTIKESNVATGITIQYMAPLFVMAYGVHAGEERVGLVKVSAAIISLFGCFLVVGGYAPEVFNLSTAGALSGVGSIICYSFMTIFGRHVLERYNNWTVTFYSVSFAALFWFVVNPPTLTSLASVSSEIWGALFLLAIFSVLIPHSLFFGGLRYLVPSRAIITSTLEPVVAIISAAIVLGEFLEPLQSFGALLVLAAIILLQVSKESKPIPEPISQEEYHDS